MIIMKKKYGKKMAEILKLQFYILLSLKGSKNSLCKLGKTEFNGFFLLATGVGGGDNREGKTKASLIDF